MLDILFEDEHILVVKKNAGIATEAAKVSEKDMMSEVNNYLKKAGAKAPAYLIHRLDKPVMGILLLAKTKRAAAALSENLKSDAFSKHYYALCEGDAKEYTEGETVEIENKIYKDNALRKAVIVEDNSKENTKDKDVKTAKLLLKKCGNDTVLKVLGNKVQINPNEYTLFDIKLITGRFHQIRCQLSNLGYPIVSDKTYGAKKDLREIKGLNVRPGSIGLIAYSLSFAHPVTKKIMTFELQMPLRF